MIRQYFLFAFFLFFVSTSVHSQTNDWTLKKDEQGIKVYTKPMPGSDFNSFRAIMTLNATPAELYAILKNLPAHPTIFPETEKLEIVQKINDSTHLQYSVTHAPWPVSDRDGIFQMNFTKLKPSGFSVKSWAVPNFMPEVEGIVRIKKSKSSWTVKNLGSGKIHVVYEVATEPGGYIPDWLANAAATDIPFQTFVNLRNELQRVKGSK